MDFFSIHNAITCAVTLMFRAQRRTGRTSAMVTHVKPEDVIIFDKFEEAQRVARLVKVERGFTLNTLTAPPGDFERVASRVAQHGIKGRVIFDHGWLEACYMQSLKFTGERIEAFGARMEAEMSGAKSERASFNPPERMKWKV